MPPEQKTSKLLIRFAPSELEMLQELSDARGLTKADVVRQLIRNASAAEALEKTHGPIVRAIGPDNLARDLLRRHGEEVGLPRKSEKPVRRAKKATKKKTKKATKKKTRSKK